MALQDDIRELIAARHLPQRWTTADLQSVPALNGVYTEAYLATQPANRSIPVHGMERLGIGNHVANGRTALFLRVGTRDGALLFELADASPGVTVDSPAPSNSGEDTTDDRMDPVEEDGTFTPVTEANNWIEDGEHYLSSDETIRALVDYLKGLLGDGPPVAHCYRHRRPAYQWQCLGLLEAVERYRFPVINYKNFHALVGPPPRDTLTANSTILLHLQNTLRNAWHIRNEALIVDTAIDILVWGGTNRGGHNEERVRAASARPNGFLGYLDLCQRSFGTGTSVNLAPFIGSGYAICSNAGFTKIYALALDNFIIYDSRVAAALGLIVVRCLALCGHRNAAIPASVAFRADNRGQSAQQRDPNSNAFGLMGFPLANGNEAREHLMWNIRANALLTRVLAGSEFEKAVLGNPARFSVQPVRALEAALFMIGYDLGGNWPHLH